MSYVSPRLLEFKRPAEKIPTWAGKGYAPSRYAAFNSADYLKFPRTQSPAMAAREWERESLLQKLIGLFK